MRYVRKKWEMWEKVRCVRKSEKNVRKREICEEKVREVWVKVKCGKKWRHVRKRWEMWEKSEKCEKSEACDKKLKK